MPITIPNGEMNEFDLPKVCVVTGATDNVSFRDVKFAWYPRWIPVLILINLLVAAVVAAILTKRSKGKLPFSDEAFAAWRRAKIATVLVTLETIAMFFVSIFFIASERTELGAVALLLTIVTPIVVGITLVRKRGPKVTKITDKETTFELPSEAAMFRFTEHLKPGVRARAASAA